MRWAIVFIFIITTILGASLMMAKMENGDMSACPLMGEIASLCEMSPLEHLNIWQSIFSVTALALILGVAILASFTLANNTIFGINSYLKKKKFSLDSRLSLVLRL